MEPPHLDWTVTAVQTPVLRVLNTVNSRLPLWTWHSARLVRLREVIAHRLLGLDDLPIQRIGELTLPACGVLAIGQAA